MDLPTSIKIHDVFHPSLLQKTSADLLSGQHNDPASPIIVDDGKEEWEVDDILDARRVERSRKVQFCVKWKRYDEDKEWYNASGFEHLKDIVEDFYQRNLTKPR